MYLAFKAVDKTGANGAVDHTSRKGTLVGRTCFTLQIATGDAPNCIHFLDEVNRKGKEVVVLLLADNSRNQHGCVALGDQHRAGCLLG